MAIPAMLLIAETAALIILTTVEPDVSQDNSKHTHFS